MRWYAVLFWIWVIGSLLALIWRRANPSSRPSSSTAAPAVDTSRDRVWAPPPSDGPLGPGFMPATTVSSESPGSAAVDRAHTLPELLAGITLPYGLVPLTQSSGSHDLATHIVVATSSAPADEVTQGLTDELERLGYTVSRTGQYLRLAEGSRGEVGFEVHPNAASVVDSGAPRFPTAAPGTVVVELRAL